MMNNDDFINQVWKKYSDYEYSNIKDSFYNSHPYKNKNNLAKYFIMYILILICITSTIGWASANKKTQIKQQNTNRSFGNNMQDMVLYDESAYDESAGFWYKKIYTYDDYNLELNKWESLIDMKEKDFENNFLLIISGRNHVTTGLYISDIYVVANKTIVDLKRKDKWVDNENTIIAIVPKVLDKEKIELNYIPNIIYTNAYMSLSEIPVDYSAEQAVSDGCIVVDFYGNLISDNRYLLDNFIDTNENQVIRIYRVIEDYFSITDIEYKNGVVNVNRIGVNTIDKAKSELTCFSGNRLEKYDIKDGISSVYCVLNDIGDAERIIELNNN